MTVRIRHDVSETGKTGWRWACRVCPHVRGRPRGGFHHDRRFVDWAKPRRYRPAWNRCVAAAFDHVHAVHQPRTKEQP